MATSVDAVELDENTVPNVMISPISTVAPVVGTAEEKIIAQMPKMEISGATGATGGSSLVGRAGAIHPLSENIDNVVDELENYQSDLKKIEKQSAPHFPNLAWESIKAGLAQEKITNGKLNGHIKDAEKLQKEIDLLLDLSAELTAHPEGAVPSDKMKALLIDLKQRGIDLWKGEDRTFSKERISELKSLANAQVDRLRSNLQIIFTTKIQVLIQTIGSIMETLKDIIRNNTKLINAANRLPGR